MQRIPEDNSTDYSTTVGVPSTEKSSMYSEFVAPFVAGHYITRTDLDHVVGETIIYDLVEPSNLFPGM